MPPTQMFSASQPIAPSGSGRLPSLMVVSPESQKARPKHSGSTWEMACMQARYPLLLLFYMKQVYIFFIENSESRDNKQEDDLHLNLNPKKMIMHILWFSSVIAVMCRYVLSLTCNEFYLKYISDGVTQTRTHMLF